MMARWSDFKSWFAKTEEIEAPSLEGGEQAWADVSRIYTGNDFTKYNPDSLIGRKGFGIYRRMMQDEQVKAVVKFKRDAISARGFTFEDPVNKEQLSDEEIKKRKDIFEAILAQAEGSWIDQLNGVLTALYNGFSMSEITTKHIDLGGLTWLGLAKLKLKPYDSFEFNVDEFGNTETVIQKQGVKRKEIDIDKFIHFVVNPDVDEHYGGSELREAYRAWFSKDMAIKFRNIWLERFAGGFRVLKPTNGKTLTINSPEYLALKNILANINLTTSIILPHDIELTTEFPGKGQGGSSNPFSTTIDQSDLQIARALLVPPLLGVSPQGDTGSYSQSTTQLQAFFWTLNADSTRVEDCLNEQLFRPLGLLNFGDAYYPRFKFNPISKEEAISIIKLFVELVDKKIIGMSPEDEEFIRSALNLPSVQTVTEQTDPSKTPEQNVIVDPNKENVENEDGREEGEELPDEEILGKGFIEIIALSRAETRVNFSAIEKTSEQSVEKHTEIVSHQMGDLFAELIVVGKEGGELDEDVSKNIVPLTTDPRIKAQKRKINTQVNRALKDGDVIGTRNAKQEIAKAAKAEGKDFTKVIVSDMSVIKFIADDYFKTTAFSITGNLTDEATKLVENEILNGAKFDKTWEEVEQAIYEAAATKGLISPEQARDALAEALKVENPDARIRTIVRTSTFDAINNARNSYFTDPQLGGFVKAFEYSAILDSRTTQICRHLDDENAGDHTSEWYSQNAGFRPPNHFNCRSLLIAITTVDFTSFVEGPQPSIEPQEGFK